MFLNRDFVVLIMLGKDSGSCRHACIYCEDGTPWKNPSKLNTFGSLKKWNEVVFRYINSDPFIHLYVVVGG